MKELSNDPRMDMRTVKAYETNNGGYVQVYDVRDINHGQYSVERYVHGGMETIYSHHNLNKCIVFATKYANTH